MVGGKATRKGVGEGREEGRERGGGGGRTKEISMRGGGKRGENKPTNQTSGSDGGPRGAGRAGGAGGPQRTSRAANPRGRVGRAVAQSGRASCQASERAGCNRRVGRAEPDGRVTKAWVLNESRGSLRRERDS